MSPKRGNAKFTPVHRIVLMIPIPRSTLLSSPHTNIQVAASADIQLYAILPDSTRNYIPITGYDLGHPYTLESQTYVSPTVKKRLIITLVL